MAITLVNVTGTLTDLSGGQLYEDGTIEVELNGPGEHANIPIVGKRVFPVVQGVLSFKLIPCDEITMYDGSEALYVVRFNVPRYPRTPEIWNVKGDVEVTK